MITFCTSRPRAQHVRRKISRQRLLVTRRRVQLALGLVWLLDGLLQLQPFMFGRGFATQVIAPAASGQPGWIHWLVSENARLILIQPGLFDTAFALVQIALGIGFLFHRTTRLAAPVSVAWALGVWVLGEGFGDVFGAHVTMLTGSPGAALIYAALALAAWPDGNRDDGPVAPWIRYVWAAIWLLGALLLALPWNRTGTALAASLTGATDSLPSFLVRGTVDVAHYASRHATLVVGILIVVQVAGAVLVFGPRRLRQIAAGVGAGLAFLIWISAEAFGELTSGQATDPNSGPLLILLAAATAACIPGRRDGALHPRDPSEVVKTTPQSRSIGLSHDPTVNALTPVGEGQDVDWR
jgi:hypothetical protein